MSDRFTVRGAANHIDEMVLTNWGTLERGALYRSKVYTRNDIWNKFLNFISYK